MYTYIHSYTCIHTYMHTYIHMQTYILQTCLHIYKHRHTYMHAYIRLCAQLLERFRFYLRLTLNVCGEYPCHVMSNFRSPTQMQAKNIFLLTRPMCCVSVVLNAFVNSAHILKHILFA